MARIRSIKPEMRTSEKVTSWPIPIRYFWVLLWGYFDDFGRGRDNPRLIKADAFPLDDDIDVIQVEAWLTFLAGEHVITRYQVDGARYLCAPNWREHQRPGHPSKSVTPCPHGMILQGTCEAHATLLSDAGDTPPRAGRGEHGAVEQGDAPDGAEPPAFCPKHPKGAGGTPCGPCGDARTLHQAWSRSQKAIPTPRPPRKSIEKHCDVAGHEDYVLDRAGTCAKCDREGAAKASSAFERQGKVA